MGSTGDILNLFDHGTWICVSETCEPRTVYGFEVSNIENYTCFKNYIENVLID